MVCRSPIQVKQHVINKDTLQEFSQAGVVSNAVIGSCFTIKIRQVEDYMPDIWHIRLGHVLDEVLKHVPDVQFNSASFYCNICPTAKQHRLAFNNNESSATYIFELLHCDV